MIDFGGGFYLLIYSSDENLYIIELVMLLFCIKSACWLDNKEWDKRCNYVLVQNTHSLKFSDNNSIHVIYNRPQNPSNSADTLEAAMLAQGVC